MVSSWEEGGQGVTSYLLRTLNHENTLSLFSTLDREIVRNIKERIALWLLSSTQSSRSCLPQQNISYRMVQILR